MKRGVLFPSELTRVSDTVFFAADDGNSGRELWKTDGTDAGTFRVADIFPGPGSSLPLPAGFTNVAGTLFFVATDGISGLELWKSDGTPAGTVRVTDVAPGPLDAFDSQVFLVGGPDLIDVNGTLFFVATDGAGAVGHELWKSDGTSSGTELVKDIVPGSESAFYIYPQFGSTPLPAFFTNVNGTLFFVAGVSGQRRLYESDGPMKVPV